MSFYLFNTYSWPGTIYPTIFNLPFNLSYGGLFYLTEGNYALSFFLPNFVVEFLGAVSLYKITGVVLKHYKISNIYAFYSVLFFAFNAEIIVGGLWANGFFDLGTAFLPILIYISYLSIFKSKRYYLLLIFASFYLFYSFPGGYPNGAIILAEEFLISLVILSLLFASSLDIPYIRKIISFFRVFFINITMAFIGNLYLILPTIKIIPLYLNISKNPSNYFAFGVGWDSVDHIQNTVRLLNTWVINSPSLIPPWESSYLSNEIIMALLFIPFILAIFSIIFIRKKSHVILYLLFVVILFLSKANNPPFGFIFTWMVNHVVIFYPFYNGAAFYPLLIMFYSILGTITTYYLIIYTENFLKILKAKNYNAQSGNNIYIRAFIFGVISLLLIISVYPIVVGDLSIGTLEQPAGVYIEPQYLAVNSIISKSDSPLFVLPGTNAFNLNSFNNSSWYGGGDIYPNLFSSPSRSSMYPVIGQAESGSLPYNVLKYIYGMPNSAPVDSTHNLLDDIPKNASLNSITQGANISYSNVNKTKVEIKYNYSMTNNPSGVWVSDIFTTPFNASPYCFIILNSTNQNVNLSNLRIGLSYKGNSTSYVGPGDWYYVGEENGIYNSFVDVKGNYSSIIIQIHYPTESLGVTNLSHLTSITIRNTPGQSGYGYLNISSIKFAKANYTKESLIFSNDMTTLGFKYILLDSSIQNTPYPYRIGNYYNSMFNDSPFFKEIYHNQSLTLLENLKYKGIFSTENKFSYSNSSSLLGSVYYNSTFNDSTIVTNNLRLVTETKNLTSSSYISCEKINPLKYTLKIHSTGKFLLLFRETFNKNFIAKTLNGTILNYHFLANGYANAWIVPKNVTYLTICYQGSQVYAYTEFLFILVPFFSLTAFLICESKRFYAMKRS